MHAWAHTNTATSFGYLLPRLLLHIHFSCILGSIYLYSYTCGVLIQEQQRRQKLPRDREEGRQWGDSVFVPLGLALLTRSNPLWRGRTQSWHQLLDCLRLELLWWSRRHTVATLQKHAFYMDAGKIWTQGSQLWAVMSCDCGNLAITKAIWMTKSRNKQSKQA